MTHTPTLPNGFSRDFSEAPSHEWLLVWQAHAGGAFSAMPIWKDSAGRFLRADESQVYPVNDRLLCWAPYASPGDAVLKELAEEGE